MLQYKSIEELVRKSLKENKKISDIVIEDQAAQEETTADELIYRMGERYEIMEKCTRAEELEHIKSTSGLTGGDAYRMYRHIKSGKSLTGNLMAGALMRALAVSETNAGMGRIVAAPTAGSCGIVPAVLATLEAEGLAKREDCVRALFTAGAVGMIIAENASVAGAEGGCQAECGSAAAMAAAAAVEIMDGTPRQCANAVAISIKNILGLVCDPVAGLVEIPCIKRNAAGVANALTAAEMALAQIESKIPADEVIGAMKSVGDAMSRSLKETAEGGLAATPTGKKLHEQVFGAKADESAGCFSCRACRM